MEQQYKDRLLSRIISGVTYIEISGIEYLLKEPYFDIKYRSSLVYEKFVNELKFFNILDNEEILGFLVYRGLWNDSDEQELKVCETNIEKLKVGIFESFSKSKERELARKALRKTESLQLDLLGRRHGFDYISIDHIAQTLKLQYLLLRSLYDIGGERVCGEDCLDTSSPFLNTLMELYTKNQITSENYRELARDNTWQDYWCAAKRESSLFGKASIEYTLEQRLLVSWSRLYDNIRQSSHIPSEDVINDNDALDGWLIVEGRNRKTEQNKHMASDILEKHPHLKNAEEIYLMADTAEDAKIINDLNSPVAKFIKKQRLDMIAAQGHVPHVMLPDVQQRLVGEFTQKRRG